MLANFSRVKESADVDELVFFLGHVREASRNFAELGDRFRKATSRNITPSVLKHDINTVFAVQAGDLLCQCWRRGMLSVYRPHFYFPDEDEPRIRFVFSWFSFIRWHLASIFKNRFRDDWQSEFAPDIDQLKGQDHHSQRDYQSAASEDANDLVLWRLNLYADVQATACDVLAEELGQLAEAVEQRLRQLPGDLAKLQRQEGNAADMAGKNVKQPPQPLLPKEHLTSWREILVSLGMTNNDENKQKVDRLNKSFSGPILKPGQGAQPFVEKRKLLEWWNGLEKMVQDQADRSRDAKETVKETYAYGRNGEVVPQISGQEKKRRKDRKP